VSLSAPSSEAQQPETDSDSAASSSSDSDSAQPPRKQRKKVGHYNRPLTREQRLDILEKHISEGKSAASISALYKDKGITVPVGTIYTIIRRQVKGEPLLPRTRQREHRYSEADAALIVQLQLEHHEWRYVDLRQAWKEANPDREEVPCNWSIHQWLEAADVTNKMLTLIPVGRNTPEAMEFRREYSLRAMAWARECLIFIDETTFGKGKHRSRGRSKKGTLAVQLKRNSPGKGIKVCAAVSPSLGLVMFKTQMEAYNGDTFAAFMADLCKHPFVRQRSCIFVVDNVYVHFVQQVQDVLSGQAIHHTMERLPKYSPHLNPIEYCFHNWKSEIKLIDQVVDRRSLRQQVEDTRTCITSHLVARILDHVYQLYAHCIEMKPLDEFKPIGHRVARSQVEAQLQRNVIAAGAVQLEEEEHKE
jgi:hypothetical protein